MRSQDRALHYSASQGNEKIKKYAKIPVQLRSFLGSSGCMKITGRGVDIYSMLFFVDSVVLFFFLRNIIRIY